MSNLEVFAPETVRKFTDLGINLESLARLSSKDITNVNRQFHTKIYYHLHRQALLREAKSRGIVLENLKPGTVVIMEEDDEGQMRRYHGVVVSTDSYCQKQMKVKVWFPSDGGGVHTCHISELVGMENLSVEVNQQGTSPTDQAKQQCMNRWKGELL